MAESYIVCTCLNLLLISYLSSAVHSVYFDGKHGFFRVRSEFMLGKGLSSTNNIIYDDSPYIQNGIYDDFYASCLGTPDGGQQLFFSSPAGRYSSFLTEFPEVPLMRSV